MKKASVSTKIDFVTFDGRISWMKSFMSPAAGGSVSAWVGTMWGRTDAGGVVGHDGALALEPRSHVVQRQQVKADEDVVRWALDEAEASFEVGPRAVVAYDMKVNRLATVHQDGL